MKQKIKRFGDEGPWLEVEIESADDCAFCEAGRHVKWPPEGTGVVFLENEQGVIRRVEGLGFGLVPGAPAMGCVEVSADEARKEIAEWGAN
jgi:hypothetical protein